MKKLNLTTEPTANIHRLLKHAGDSMRKASDAEKDFLASFIGDMLAELRRRRIDPHTLPAGLHQDADGRTMYDVTEHRGVTIVRTWDRITGGEAIDLRFEDRDIEVESVRDAEAWIDMQLDAPASDGYAEEHRLRAWQVL